MGIKVVRGSSPLQEATVSGQGRRLAAGGDPANVVPLAPAKTEKTPKDTHNFGIPVQHRAFVDALQVLLLGQPAHEHGAWVHRRAHRALGQACQRRASQRISRALKRLNSNAGQYEVNLVVGGEAVTDGLACM